MTKPDYTLFFIVAIVIWAVWAVIVFDNHFHGRSTTLKKISFKDTLEQNPQTETFTVKKNWRVDLLDARITNQKDPFKIGEAVQFSVRFKGFLENGFYTTHIIPPFKPKDDNDYWSPCLQNIPDTAHYARGALNGEIDEPVRIWNWEIPNEGDGGEYTAQIGVYNHQMPSWYSELLYKATLPIRVRLRKGKVDRLRYKRPIACQKDIPFYVMGTKETNGKKLSRELREPRKTPTVIREKIQLESSEELSEPFSKHGL